VTASHEEWKLPTCRIGRRVLVFEQIDSTNNYAASLADNPANAGIVIVAEEQLAGRGQYRRTWLCPPGDGVLMSVLLFPPADLRRPALLTAWAAVAVCDTIQQVSDLEPRIKWPNDVVIDGKKVCGILIEQGRGTVAGIGLNVNQSAESLAAANLPLAGSLAALAGRRFDREAVTRQVILHLDDAYDRLCNGDFDTLETSWKQRVGLLGERVVAECQDRTERGRLLEMGWKALTLERRGGEVFHLQPEEVRHLESA